MVGYKVDSSIFSSNFLFLLLANSSSLFSSGTFNLTSTSYPPPNLDFIC